MNDGSEAPQPAPLLPTGRAKRRRRESGERVLEAAARLFGEQGFVETSMASIAEAADVSVGTLYNLFDSKDALYAELVRREAALFRDSLVPVLRGAALEEVVDRYAEELLRLFREEADAIRLYWQVNAHARLSFRATLSEPLRAMYDETMLALASVFAQRKGEATPEAHRAALCCQALLGELFLLHVDDPDRHPADAVLSEAKRAMRALAAPFTNRLSKKVHGA